MKKKVLDMVSGSVDTEFQVSIGFHLVREYSTNRQTYIRANIEMFSTCCAPQVGLETAIKLKDKPILYNFSQNILKF